MKTYRQWIPCDNHIDIGQRYKCKVMGVCGMHGVAICLEASYRSMDAAVAGFHNKLKEMGITALTKFEVIPSEEDK